MNKLKEELLNKFGVNHSYKDFGATIKERIIYCKPEELIDWIDQKYISKEQILNLECLKEWEVGEKGGNRDEVGIANFVIKQINEEIKKL